MMFSYSKISMAMMMCGTAMSHAGEARRAACSRMVISIDKGISYGGSEPRNDPDSPALIIKGAMEVDTPGGRGDPAAKCVYFYRPDSNALADELECEGTEEECADEKYDGSHKFTGDDWPYVLATPDCKPKFDKTVPKDSPLRDEGFVQVGSDGVVTIGGLPLYQYPDDDADNCLCNFGPWASVGPDGASPQFDVAQRS